MSNLKKTFTTADQPLPGKLISKLGSWAVKAQHYPIFSQTWFRYRAMSFAAPLGVLAFLMGVICIIVANEKSPVRDSVKPYMMFLVLYIGITLNLLAGRWLATLVKKRQWPQKKRDYRYCDCLAIGYCAVFWHCPIS